MLSKNAKISIEYLYFVVKGIKIGKGYARHFSFLKEQPIIVPPLKEAKKFEDVTQIIFEQITRNRKEILSLIKQRDELLPLLMNGQVSLNSDLAVIALLIYSHLLRYPVEVHPEGYVYHPSEYGKQGYRCDDVKHT